MNCLFENHVVDMSSSFTWEFCKLRTTKLHKYYIFLKKMK